ncbi:MAG: IS200/IS605 family transposase [Limnochordia bacterium]|jgi:putative transposase
MSKDRWTTSNKAVFNIGYHLIWCPKYRRKVLVGDVETRLREVLFEKANELDVAIEAMEIMPDYVHLFVKSPPTLAPHFVVQQFKGASSRILRQEYPHLKSRLPTLWTRSYYCESVGHLSEATVQQYIEEQKGQ